MRQTGEIAMFKQAAEKLTGQESCNKGTSLLGPKTQQNRRGL
jgi:hypothetical protein